MTDGALDLRASRQDATGKTLSIENDKVIQFVVQVVHEALGDCRIFLFGSRAKGTERPNSDYDLAVEAAEEVEFSKWSSMLNRIDEEAPTLLAIDLIDLSSRAVHESLKDAIRQDGVLVG